MGSPSKQVVAKLMERDPAIHDTGFRKAVSALMPDSRYFAECVARILPDAWAMDENAGVVTIYEVVDSHPIRAQKAEYIAELSDELDDAGWELAVVTLDYTGHVTSALPGYAYFPPYTAMVAPNATQDMTPAARAVMREDAGGPRMTLEELAAAVRRIP